MPNENCTGATPHDCFYADRECPACLWDSDEPFLKMAERYERTAQLVIRAPGGGVRADLLNWLAGHHVGTYVRLGDLGRARTTAETCYAALWWCDALRAYIAHELHDFAVAEELFRRSLRLAPRHIRCLWNDITPMVDSLLAVRLPGGRPGLVGPLGPCRELSDVEHFWLLADPLFSTPGNERMTEHYARQVDLQISRDFVFMMRNPGLEGGFAGLYPPTISHGRPTAYQWRSVNTSQLGSGAGAPHAPGARPPLYRRQAAPWSGGYTARGRVNLEFGSPIAQSFTVDMSLAEAMSATHVRFEPADRNRRESYRAPYGRVSSFPLQTGFFRRNGEPVLLVRSNVPAHEQNPARDWQLHTYDGKIRRRADVRRSADTLIAVLPTEWLPQIVSLEAQHDSGAYRARTGNRPPETANPIALSSLVLIDGTTAPASLEHAARAMLPDITIARGQRTGGYWELYMQRTRSAAIEVAVRRTDAGVLARLFGRQSDRIVRWTEELQPHNGVVTRAIRLDLDTLDPGEYDVALTLTLDSDDVLGTVTRVIVVQ